MFKQHTCFFPFLLFAGALYSSQTTGKRDEIVIKVINLAIAASLTLGVTAASAETVVKSTIVDPALSRALDTLRETYNNRTYSKKSSRGQVVAGKPKAHKRSQRNLDKVLILGGVEAFPM